MTPYQEFSRLLHGACFAAEAVDHFDLQGDQPGNVAVWNWLLNERHKAEGALLSFVLANSAAIITGMPEPPDVPSLPPTKALHTSDLIAARFAFVTKYALEASAAAQELDGIEKPYALRLKFAHGRSIGNRQLLSLGGPCGCFYCLRTFDAGEIKDWVDADGATALCPYCGIDAILSGKADPIDPLFLHRMKARWFGRVSPA
jgi:hypothetical protein